MRAIQSKILKEILNNNQKAKQLKDAVEKFYFADKDSIEVIIGDKTYTLKFVRGPNAD